MPPNTGLGSAPGGNSFMIAATYSATRGSPGATGCADSGSVTSRKTTTFATTSSTVIQWTPRGLG
jgi:hypothetical protein